ncbi:MAG: 7-cyano-7-deazaguanine synthase [Tepidisphaeraceae bacterium]
MAKELAIILSNGSINSAVVTALAAQKHRLVMLHVDTGPSPGRAGLAFDQQVQSLKPYRSHHAPMNFLAGLEKTDSKPGAVDPRAGEDVSQQLLSLTPIIAVGMRYAAHYNAMSVYAGIRVGPDGSDLARVTEHAQIWAEMMQLTCDRPNLDLQLPLLELEPWQVVDLGVQVAAPMGQTWTCDSGVGEPCGGCRGCRMRDNAFVRAGKTDPSKAKEIARAG